MVQHSRTAEVLIQRHGSPAVAIYHSALPIPLPLLLRDSEHVIWSQQATSQAKTYTPHPAAAVLQATQFAFHPRDLLPPPTSNLTHLAFSSQPLADYLHSQGCSFLATLGLKQIKRQIAIELYNIFAAASLPTECEDGMVNDRNEMSIGVTSKHMQRCLCSQMGLPVHT